MKLNLRAIYMLALTASLFFSACAPVSTPLPPEPTAAPTATIAATPTGNNAAAPKPSGFIAKVTMAEDAGKELAEPVNPTTVFKPTSIFHAITTLNNAPAKTKFKAVWYAVDVGNVVPPNTVIDQSDLETEGSRNLDFFLKPETKWPVGTYRVEIFVNGVLDQVANFSVK